MIVLTIYSRPGCHLCDEMKAVVQRAARSVPLTVEEIDISLDAELDERYGLEIPVLMVNGKKAAKYRVTEEELARILVARAGESGGSASLEAAAIDGHRYVASVPPTVWEHACDRLLQGIATGVEKHRDGIGAGIGHG